MELIGSDVSAVDEVCEDWWRKHVYPSESLSRVCALLDTLTLERLKAVAPKAIAKPDSVLQPDPDQPNGATQETVERAIEATVVYWQQKDGAIRKAFEDARTEGFPMDPIVAHAIPQLAQLIQDGSQPIATLGGLIAFTSDRIPKERAVDYALPAGVSAFAEACQKISAATTVTPRR